MPTSNYLKQPTESLRNPGALFFRPKTASKWPKTTKNRQNTHYFEIFCAIFSTKKCADGAHAPYPLATTSNNLQKASGTPAYFFFERKRPQNGQKRPKTVKIRLILRYFALFLARKKCAEGAHTPCPLATTPIHHQKASGTPAHFFVGPKRPQNGQKRPKTVKTRLS